MHGHFTTRSQTRQFGPNKGLHLYAGKVFGDFDAVRQVEALGPFFARRFAGWPERRGEVATMRCSVNQRGSVLGGSFSPALYQGPTPIPSNHGS